MDDLIIATKTEKDMQQVKKLLQSQFKMKDMGELHYCLGITIKQDKADKTVEIQKKQYIIRILEKYGLQDSKPVSTPADPNAKLKKDDRISKPVDLALYQSTYSMQQLQLDQTSLKLLGLFVNSAQNLQKLT